MQDLKESIIKCIQKNAGSGPHLVDKLNRVIDDFGDSACSEIFLILTNLEFSPPEARKYWDKICTHKMWMEEMLQRKVTLRTTICDFFSSEDVFLINPKIIEIHDFEEKVQLSRIDFLTGLYSRKYFEERVEEEINRSKRHNSELSLIFFDLDFFKKVNDNYGHLAGDHILREVSKIIIENRREGDITARYGGEELVIVLPHTKNLQALIYGERIREMVESHIFNFELQDIHITISGGISSFPRDGEDAKSIIRAADTALYAAKNSGRNDISVFSSDNRQYLRVDLVTQVFVVNKENNQTPGTNHKSKNLSKNGILFESEREFDLGTLIQMDVHINDSSPSIKITGTVVRVETFGENHYDIGVSFSSLDKDIKKGISRYIVDQLKLRNSDNELEIQTDC
ncbi:MAG: diguanylate cyclase [Proteobacteria bacterium]|nr:diguanylate cyclase [Pseudomonadota bacterium]